MGKDKNGSFGWLLSQSGERKGKFIASVVLAAISMLCGIVPYYFIAGIVKDLLAGSTDKRTYIMNCAVILALWLGHSLFHALSTANSHLATINEQIQQPIQNIASNTNQKSFHLYLNQLIYRMYLYRITRILKFAQL